jgi:hypothetical protein
MKAQVIKKVLDQIQRKNLSKSDLELISDMYEKGLFLSVEILIAQAGVN